MGSIRRDWGRTQLQQNTSRCKSSCRLDNRCLRADCPYRLHSSPKRKSNKGTRVPTTINTPIVNNRPSQHSRLGTVANTAAATNTASRVAEGQELNAISSRVQQENGVAEHLNVIHNLEKKVEEMQNMFEVKLSEIQSQLGQLISALKINDTRPPQVDPSVFDSNGQRLAS